MFSKMANDITGKHLRDPCSSPFALIGWLCESVCMLHTRLDTRPWGKVPTSEQELVSPVKATHAVKFGGGTEANGPGGSERRRCNGIIHGMSFEVNGHKLA